MSLRLNLNLRVDHDFELEASPLLLPHPLYPPSLFPFSGGIKERWCHQRPVTTRVNGASHMCSPIDTHCCERQTRQLETEVFGDSGQGY